MCECECVRRLLTFVQHKIISYVRGSLNYKLAGNMYAFDELLFPYSRHYVARAFTISLHSHSVYGLFSRNALFFLFFWEKRFVSFISSLRSSCLSLKIRRKMYYYRFHSTFCRTRALSYEYTNFWIFSQDSLESDTRKIYCVYIILDRIYITHTHTHTYSSHHQATTKKTTTTTLRRNE